MAHPWSTDAHTEYVKVLLDYLPVSLATVYEVMLEHMGNSPEAVATARDIVDALADPLHVDEYRQPTPPCESGNRKRRHERPTPARSRRPRRHRSPSSRHRRCSKRHRHRRREGSLRRRSRRLCHTTAPRPREATEVSPVAAVTEEMPPPPPPDPRPINRPRPHLSPPRFASCGNSVLVNNATDDFPFMPIITSGGSVLDALREPN